MQTAPHFVGYIAMSLDGFIATPDGGVEWLDQFNTALSECSSEDAGGYNAFIEKVDAVLMGRTTYNQVLGWGWPYGERAGYVLTHRRDFTGDHVTAAGPIEHLRDAIQTNGHKHVWVMGGGATQRAALDAGMFDELSLFVMPILLGDGLPCFAKGTQRNLSLNNVAAKPGGILQIDYTFKE
ncbi:dihydrofolate reductase family protein [Shimia sp. NS0008-38b]|uniref:dihydrofolate reductase family protein n=1 Tax=Shimia sp. NS0008-38b TaxID=3127653 RepID=UPI003108A885